MLRFASVQLSGAFSFRGWNLNPSLYLPRHQKIGMVLARVTTRVRFARLTMLGKIPAARRSRSGACALVGCALCQFGQPIPSKKAAVLSWGASSEGRPTSRWHTVHWHTVIRVTVDYC